jgi:ribosomal protein S18 acetylase RimI-like enzyme
MEYIENIKPIGGVICQTVTKSEKYYKFLGQYLNILFDLDEYLNNPTINQIIAIKSNNLIGARMFRINDGFIHLSYTAVIPEERGKSINHRMLLEIEKIALNRDIDKITSTARISNFASNRSLVKSGFILDESKETTYSCGEKKLHYYKFL